jgi:alkyl sulfatase BDS1-like metallo-beta-lactamase superfamily hydrolase
MKQEDLGGLATCINWNFTDTKEQWIMGISNRTLYYTPGRQAVNAEATVTLARTTLIDVVTQSTTFMDQIQEGNITIDGDGGALLTVFGNIDIFEMGFAIVEP